MTKKLDYQFVTLYTIHVTKHDHTGYYKHYLDETEASQDFWKALKDNFYLKIEIEKEKHLFVDLPQDIQEKVTAMRKQQEQMQETTAI